MIIWLFCIKNELTVQALYASALVEEKCNLHKHTLTYHIVISYICKIINIMAL